MKKLRAGIIGLGVGEQHIAGYHRHPGCRVVSLCDFSRGALVRARKKYPGLQIASRAEDILFDPQIDVVSIASYDNYHYGQVRQALLNGKHVFVEKPLCLRKREAGEIRALLKKNPCLRLSSNLILRACPRFRYLRGEIQSGRMGRIFYAEGSYDYGRLEKITRGWRGKIDFYSVIYGGGVHIVDLLLWLTNDTVTEVSAYGNRIAACGSQFRYNDFSVAILKFKSGLVGKVASNFGCVFPHFHQLAVYGTERTFVNGLGYGTMYRSRDPAAKPRKIASRYPAAHKGELIYSFIDSIVTGKPGIVTAEDTFKTMSVCFAMEKAVNKSRAVKVDYV